MKRRERRNGRVLVLTGEGKGKSSSAFGMVFRAAGWGMRVQVVQFIKGKWKTGERQAAARFENIEWHTLGEGFTWQTNDPDRDRETARRTWDFCVEGLRAARHDLIVWDEICYAISYGWLSGAEVAGAIRAHRPPWMHLVLTGRGAPPELVEVADTVTEMRKVKHAFDAGIRAEQGVEF